MSAGAALWSTRIPGSAAERTGATDLTVDEIARRVRLIIADFAPGVVTDEERFTEDLNID
jgi:hypothetical protein